MRGLPPARLLGLPRAFPASELKGDIRCAQVSGWWLWDCNLHHWLRLQLADAPWGLPSLHSYVANPPIDLLVCPEPVALVLLLWVQGAPTSPEQLSRTLQGQPVWLRWQRVL